MTTSKLPAFGPVEPQLATPVDEVPTRGDWIYELKYDGYRAIATVEGGRARVASRSGKDWSRQFASVTRALTRLPVKSAVLDGEIAYVMEDGRTDFQSLQSALGGRSDPGRVVYFVFDLLYCDGADLTGEPLEARKNRLRAVLAGEKPPLMMGDHVRGDGRVFFARVCELGLEGVIAKRADRPYRGGRGPDWVKVKCHKRQEMVIVGSTAPRGQRSGIGALLLAVREGDTYRYAGKVGTGFTQASLADLSSRLEQLAVAEPPLEAPPRVRDVRWVRPELVCQVRFSEWTREGVLRHPSFEGLREDKEPETVLREDTASLEQLARQQATSRARRR